MCARECPLPYRSVGSWCWLYSQFLRYVCWWIVCILSDKFVQRSRFNLFTVHTLVLPFTLQKWGYYLYLSGESESDCQFTLCILLVFSWFPVALILSCVASLCLFAALVRLYLVGVVCLFGLLLVLLLFGFSLIGVLWDFVCLNLLQATVIYRFLGCYFLFDYSISALLSRCCAVFLFYLVVVMCFMGVLACSWIVLPRDCCSCTDMSETEDSCSSTAGSDPESDRRVSFLYACILLHKHLTSPHVDTHCRPQTRLYQVVLYSYNTIYCRKRHEIYDMYDGH